MNCTLHFKIDSQCYHRQIHWKLEIYLDIFYPDNDKFPTRSQLSATLYTAVSVFINAFFHFKVRNPHDKDYNVNLKKCIWMNMNFVFL